MRHNWLIKTAKSLNSDSESFGMEILDVLFLKKMFIFDVILQHQAVSDVTLRRNSLFLVLVTMTLV